MINKILEKILNWVKLSSKHWLAIGLVVAILSTALLFLPLQVLRQFGVDLFLSYYRMWVGFFCLASYSILLVLLIGWFKEKISEKLVGGKRKKILRDITPEEKRILAKYVLLQTKSQCLSINCGVTNGLVHSVIIYLASSISDLGTSFAYNIQPWAWKELNAHPELLEPELSNLRKEMERSRDRNQRINLSKLY